MTKWSTQARVHPRTLGRKPLGRRVSETDEHVRAYPLTALRVEEQPRGVPIQIGVNWYSNFDNPVLGDDGRWFIGRGDLGSVRGGHAVTLKPGHTTDWIGWHGWYDQGREGACVGFSGARVMTLMNRVKYVARWLWDQAKLIDEWADTNPGDDNGTSVRACMEVLRSSGLVPWKRGYGEREHDLAFREGLSGDPVHGIAVYRWATDVQDVFRVLASPTADRIGAVPMLNSWGRDYPHIVWLPGETLDRLLREDGEIAVPTDR